MPVAIDGLAGVTAMLIEGRRGDGQRGGAADRPEGRADGARADGHGRWPGHRVVMVAVSVSAEAQVTVRGEVGGGGVACRCRWR